MERIQSTELKVNALTAGAAGALATERAAIDPNAFEPNTGTSVDIIRGTLGHSGNGADGNQKYHVPGNFSSVSEVVRFN